MKNWQYLFEILKTFSVKKSRASVLSYAIVIALLNVFVILAVILKVNYKSMELDAYKIRCQVREIIHSVSNILEDSPQYFIDGNSYSDFLENEVPNYMVKVTMRKWGLYFISNIEASYKTIKQSKFFLFADDVRSLNKIPSLYLSAKKTYLSLSGNTYLGTNCYLPEYGVRSASFGGKSYSRNSYVFGETYNAHNELPVLNIEAKEITSQLNTTNSYRDSIVDFDLLDKKGYICNSFKNKTLVCYSASSIRIDNFTLKGNIKIISAKSILIKNNAILEDVIISAPIIEIEKGFSGNAQFFATNILECGENCHFKIPTVFLLNNNSDKDQILIGSKTRLFGEIIVLNNMQNRKAALRIEPECELVGQIYCNGYVAFEGTLFGTLYTRGILKYTTSGLRLNVLEDACIDVNRLPIEYYGYSLIERNCKKKLSDELF